MSQVNCSLHRRAERKHRTTQSTTLYDPIDVVHHPFSASPRPGPLEVLAIIRREAKRESRTSRKYRRSSHWLVCQQVRQQNCEGMLGWRDRGGRERGSSPPHTPVWVELNSTHTGVWGGGGATSPSYSGKIFPLPSRISQHRAALRLSLPRTVCYRQQFLHGSSKTCLVGTPRVQVRARSPH